MEGNIKIVKNVAQSIQNNRVNCLEDLQTEYVSSSQWLSLAFESFKRKIGESSHTNNEKDNERNVKRTKADLNVELSENIENIHPNSMMLENPAPTEEIVKDIKLEQEFICGPSKVLDEKGAMSLKVVELREELLKRGLDATGLKKKLQSRLLKAIKVDEEKTLMYMEKPTSNVDIINKGDNETEVEVDMQKSNSKDDSAMIVEKPVYVDGGLGKETQVPVTNDDKVQNDQVQDYDNVKKHNLDECILLDDEVQGSQKHLELPMIDATKNRRSSTDDSRRLTHSLPGAKTYVILPDLLKIVEKEDVRMEECSNASATDVMNKCVENQSSKHQNKVKEDNSLTGIIGNISENRSESATDESSGNSSEICERNETEDVDISGKKGLGNLIKATTKFLFSPKKKDIQNPKKCPGFSSTSATSNENISISDKECMASDDLKDGNEVSVAHSGEVPTVHENDNITNSKRVSIVCKMTESEILEKEDRRKLHKTIEPNSEKKVLPDEKANLDHKTAYRVVRPEKIVPSDHLQPKVIATPMVSNKPTSDESNRPVLSKSALKAKALADARKTRLAEIRGKVINKTVTLDHAKTKKNDMLHSTVLSQTKPKHKMAANEIRKRALATQMRQKAANASKNKAGHPQSGSSSTPKSKISLQQNAKVAFLQKQKVLSPMDTYEMSDREGSDSGESDNEERGKKKIPKWAKKENLVPALEKQFLEGVNKMDPDEIFPEVTSCDLEAIFDKKKSRYIKRTSSGNWTKDSVTQAEKLVYKRNMGFKK